MVVIKCLANASPNIQQTERPTTWQRQYDKTREFALADEEQ